MVIFIVVALCVLKSLYLQFTSWFTSAIQFTLSYSLFLAGYITQPLMLTHHVALVSIQMNQVNIKWISLQHSGESVKRVRQRCAGESGDCPVALTRCNYWMRACLVVGLCRSDHRKKKIRCSRWPVNLLHTANHGPQPRLFRPRSASETSPIIKWIYTLYLQRLSDQENVHFSMWTGSWPVLFQS